MENLKKAMIIRGGNVIGAVGDKYFSTLHIGCVIPFAGNTDNIPRGYLLADGASYPTAEYPDLYAVIGNTYGGDTENFNVPDYRETVLVGVGENTTDTIADHDVYELGEFKDDQMQDHKHSVTIGNANGENVLTTSFASTNEQRYNAYTKGMNTGRIGTTTHGKQKGVTYIIKAFHTNEGQDEGVSDDVIEYVEGEIATKLDKGYKSVADANDAIGEHGINVFILSYTSANIPVRRTGIIRSFSYVQDDYIRVNQEFSTIDNSPQNGGTYKRYGSSDDGGATFTWSNWNFVGSIDDSTTASLKTWSSSKITEEITNRAVSITGATIDDSATNTTSVWSSSKTKNYVDTLHPGYTSVAKGASYDTGWKIKSVTNGDMCRIAVVNIYDYSQSGSVAKMASYLYLITANYTNTTTLNITKIGSTGNTTTDALFEFSVSSNGTIVFTNKSDAAVDKMWVKLIKP